MKYLLCLACAVWLFYPMNVQAEPTHQAKIQDLTITLYSESCALKEVSNLPRRATWQEGSKVFEGCVGYNESLGVLMFFFLEDKSVATIPARAFTRVVSS